MSRKRSINALDKRIAHWTKLVEKFPKSQDYSLQLTRVTAQRARAADMIGKPQPQNAH